MQERDRTETSSLPPNTSPQSGDDPVAVWRGTHRGWELVGYHSPRGYIVIGHGGAGGNMVVRNAYPAASLDDARWQVHALIHDLKLDEPTAPGGRHFLPGEYPAVQFADFETIGTIGGDE